MSKLLYKETNKERLERCAVCDDRHGFLTILDNLLTVVASAGGKERAGQPYPHLGELLEGAGGGYAKRGGKLLQGDLVVTRVLREVCQDCRRPY
jgi:hypothetical protein